MMLSPNQISDNNLRNLAGDAKAKDRLICEAFGFTRFELSDIRTLKNTFEKAERGAVMLSGRGFADKVSGMTLAAIINDDWAHPAGYYKRLESLLQERYLGKKGEARTTSSWNVPLIQRFREEIGMYGGNLYEVREIWKGFVPSDMDWQHSTRLPLDIGEKAALLLGMYWGDGIPQKRDGNSKIIGFYLRGSKNDFPLYESVIRPLMKEVHNLDVKIRRKARKIPAESERGYSIAFPKSEYDTPKISLTEAVYTWLCQDLGYAPIKENVKFPRDFHQWTDSSAYEFFKGIIATKGSLMHAGRRGNLRLAISESDQGFINEIMKVSERIGYTPRIYDVNPKSKYPSRRIVFSTSQLRRMASENAIMNPYHVDKIKYL